MARQSLGTQIGSAGFCLTVAACGLLVTGLIIPAVLVGIGAWLAFRWSQQADRMESDQDGR